MRFIHTADWHLGRIMHGVQLTEDQSHVLDQLFFSAKDSSIDAFLICGDVFDRAVPPPDAVELFDDFISRIVLDLNIPVIVIAGNHDSPGRLQFGARFFKNHKLFIIGWPSAASAIALEDRYGEVLFYALPYAEHLLIRDQNREETAGDYQAAIQTIMAGMKPEHSSGKRSVLLSHSFVSGCAQAESERPLSVGGAEKLDPSCFAGFNYSALGHLHRPQQAGSPNIRYSGSLLKYSFSETDHRKSVSLVEMDSNGACRLEEIFPTPKREVRIISGSLKDILKGPVAGENRDDYVAITLLDEAPILDLMGKLREVYPNVLHISRPNLLMAADRSGATADHRKLSEVELFTAFFAQTTGTELTKDQTNAYESVIKDLRKAGREAL